MTKLYYWPRVSTDVNIYVQSCDKCHRVKNVNLQKAAATICSVYMPNKIWSKIGIDIMDTLKETGHGYRYVVTFINYLMKYPENIELKIKSAKEVGYYLYKVIFCYRCPDIIISDCSKFL